MSYGENREHKLNFSTYPLKKPFISSKSFSFWIGIDLSYWSLFEWSGFYQININNKNIIKYFRTHTHSLGKVVSGWKISNGKDWNLIGKKSPKEPQMFYPLADPELTFTKGDILAARCTMVICHLYLIDSLRS